MEVKEEEVWVHEVDEKSSQAHLNVRPPPLVYRMRVKVARELHRRLPLNPARWSSGEVDVPGEEVGDGATECAARSVCWYVVRGSPIREVRVNEAL